MGQDERRKDTRVEKHFMAHYRPAQTTDEPWCMSPLVDVSKSGARFLCEKEYAVGDHLELELHMPFAPKPQRMRAVIMRIRETTNRWVEIGVSFIVIDEKTQEGIDVLVSRFLKGKQGS